MNEGNTVTVCQLCGEHGLHVYKTIDSDAYQCLNCGYSTSHNFILKDGQTPDDNKIYSSFNDEMKGWCIIRDFDQLGKRIWIPVIMTLPFGTLFPFNDEDGNMKWKVSKLVDIPEEEQENYPDEENGGFFTKRYDTDNARVYDEFLFAMHDLNEEAKLNGVKLQKEKKLEELKKENKSLKLPKIKRNE